MSIRFTTTWWLCNLLLLSIEVIFLVENFMGFMKFLKHGEITIKHRKFINTTWHLSNNSLGLLRILVQHMIEMIIRDYQGLLWCVGCVSWIISPSYYHWMIKKSL